MSETTHGGSDRRALHERLEVWRRTGDLFALWPDIPADVLAEAHARVRAVTGVVLRSGVSDRTPRLRLEAEGPLACRALGVAGFMSGMGPLLGWWLERDRVEASPAVREVLQRHLDHGRRRSALLRENLARVVACMRAAGVDPIVLKGLHTGAVYFPEPGTRPAADIDLLVRPTERAAAAAALAAAGFREGRRTRFAARSEWVPASATGEVHSLEVDHAANPWSVDLHVALDRWYFRGLRRGLGPEAFDHTTEIPLGDGTIRGLGQPHLTAFLALHTSYELVKVQLVRVVELFLTMRADLGRGSLDWTELAALVRRSGTERFVHPAFDLVEALVPGTVDAAFLEHVGRQATSRTRRVLAAVRDGGMAPLARRSLDAKLMWARGPREVLLNLTEVVLPSDDGLRVGLGRLQWRRLAALASGGAGWRADEPRSPRGG